MKVYLYVQKSDILDRPEFFQRSICDLCPSDIISYRTHLTHSCAQERPVDDRLKPLMVLFNIRQLMKMFTIASDHAFACFNYGHGSSAEVGHSHSLWIVKTCAA
jgi:hypothetical protein